MSSQYSLFDTMAERKRLSPESDAPSSKKIKLIQTTLPFGASKRPVCKYGAKCYRKHPDHLRAYDHPTVTDTKEEEEDEEDDKDFSTKPTTTKTTASSASSSPVKQNITASSNSTISLMELAGLDDEKLLSQVYQMEFPKDLYEFWKFCSNIDNKHPRDALKTLLNLELVGPFEVLDGALKSCKTIPNIHLHYRYYYDTPEFMTVIRTVDQKSQFHIGYYRLVFSRIHSL